MVTPDYFVLFADMLGFKRLVLAHKVPLPENLDFRDRPVVRRTMASLANIGNPLSQAFTAFHGTIETLLDRTPWHEPANLVVFSEALHRDERGCWPYGGGS